MRRRLALTALPALLVASALVSSGAAAAPETGPAVADRPVAKQAPKVARGLIVKATSTSAARRSSLARSASAELPEGSRIGATRRSPSGLLLLQLGAPVPVDDLAEAVEAIEARPDVEWVTADTLRSVASAPPVAVNDPYAGVQGNLWDSRDAIDGVPTRGGFTTKAPALWRATRGSGSVVVAVVDTGIVAHPDLAGQTVAGYDFVDDECTPQGQFCYYDETYVNAGDGDGWDADPSDPGDWLDEDLIVACHPELEGVPGLEEYTSPSSWHGTHVAGTVAARAGNGIGVAGVAPGVKIQPVRVLGHCGGWDWDITNGILWAAGYDLGEPGVPVNPTPAHVINLSLGGESDDADEVAAACELYGEIAGAARAKGATLVASAGNASGTTIAPVANSVPASCDGYVSVAATSDSGHRTWYSAAGPGTDIAAPGGDTFVPSGLDESGILSTVDAGARGPEGPSYAWSEGTSMAAPAVSAGAALLYSLGITDPNRVEAGLKAAVQPFSDVTKGRYTADVGGETFRTDVLDCNTEESRTWCGTGILDLSKVTAPLGAPVISGTRAPGGVLRATSRGLTNTDSASVLTWWRGSTRIATGSTLRISAADLGRTLTVRETIASGPFAGVTARSVVGVPSAKARARVTMSMPSRVERTKRARLRVRVAAPLVQPTGVVNVYDGSRRIASRKLVAANRGTVTITLPRLRQRGKHRIHVVYGGNTVVERAQVSKTVRVR